MKLDAMALFAQVAASGSFTGAAAVAGLPKSTVSARVAELESMLGVRLLHRTTRRLSLTAAGQVYLAHCRTMLDAAHAADAAISRLRDEPAGHLRLTAPEASGILLLPPLLAAFHARHPAITVDCVITDAHLDLVAERIDLALRTGQLGDSSFVSRRVGPVRRVLVAAPAYLAAHGALDHPADLARQHLLLHDVLPQWPLQCEGKVLQVAAAGAPLRANNLNTCAAWRWPAPGSHCFPGSWCARRCWMRACSWCCRLTLPPTIRITPYIRAAATARRPSAPCWNLSISSTWQVTWPDRRLGAGVDCPCSFVPALTVRRLPGACY